MDALTQGIAQVISDGLKPHVEAINERIKTQDQLILESLTTNYLLFDLISNNFSKEQLAECRKFLLQIKNDEIMSDHFSVAADRLLSRLAALQAEK